jgi:hypothetical protein
MNIYKSFVDFPPLNKISRIGFVKYCQKFDLMNNLFNYPLLTKVLIFLIQSPNRGENSLRLS